MNQKETPTTPQIRKYSTAKVEHRQISRRIIIPMDYEAYQIQMSDHKQANLCIATQMEAYPELFPSAMNQGYKLNGWTAVSKKMPEIRLRRIRLLPPDGQSEQIAYTIAPCDILPYMTGMVSDVEKAIYLKKFGVPDSALTYVFGHNDSYWYRLTTAFGRYNIVGSTVKGTTQIPTDLLADEKHAKAHGQKWYIATTAAKDCILGASVTTSADTKGLTQAYGVFKTDAQEVEPEYQPETVNHDGWAATHKAWQQLFPGIVTILCFLHAFIKIRSRCKRLGDHYEQIKQQVWGIYDSIDRKQFQIGIDQLQNWVMLHRDSLTSGAIESLDKLCQRADQYCLAYDYPTAYRTSNMIDRHMEPMARWLASGRYFHGNVQTAEVRTRSWALLHNYWPYCPRAKIHEQYRCPAHKLNGFTYRENWLENMLVATSCQGFRYRHKKR